MNPARPIRSPTYSNLFRVLAFGAALASLYHVLCSAGLLPPDNTSTVRHMWFVLIDASAACYLLYRPLPLLPAFGALVVQQTWSHGARLLHWWQMQGRIDVVSLLVLLVLYAGLILLVSDALYRSARVRQISS